MTLTRTLSLALILNMLAVTPSALACGGGGPGSYRKPPRPGQHQQQQHSAATHPSQQGATTLQGAPQ